MSGGNQGAPVSRVGCPIIADWKLFGLDYAEPVSPGGGYVELSDDATFSVAYETSEEEQAGGCVDAFLVTSVPVAVIRELLARFDARTGK